MQLKECNVCGLKKSINDFPFSKSKNKYLSKCRQCKNEYERKYRETKREKFRKINKEQYEKNRKNRIESAKKYRKEHSNYLNKKRMENYYRRMKNDNLFRLKTMVRICIWHSFYRKKYIKKEKTEEILCCNLDFFYKYLLQTFYDNYGYEWDKIEPVHIDHIKPLSTAETEEDVIRLCHYTNLQLLKAEDNLKKGSKTNWQEYDKN